MPKHARRVEGFDEAIVSLYARGLTTGEIQPHLADIYDVDVSRDLISRVTDKVLEELTAALKVLYLVIRSPRPNRANVTGKTGGWKQALNSLACSTASASPETEKAITASHTKIRTVPRPGALVRRARRRHHLPRRAGVGPRPRRLPDVQRPAAPRGSEPARQQPGRLRPRLVPQH
ncbi:transposase [Micromonospora soli]|nr:transposase [Micromonospora sp. NBRC 110009]WKT97592.1 transposase [Micromonospora sp. NBRC 110009]